MKNFTVSYKLEEGDTLQLTGLVRKSSPTDEKNILDPVVGRQQYEIEVEVVNQFYTPTGQFIFCITCAPLPVTEQPITFTGQIVICETLKLHIQEISYEPLGARAAAEMAKMRFQP